MTTTTISDIFTPPHPPPTFTKCDLGQRCAQGVQRHLPHTGGGWLFAGIALAACVTGYALLRLSRPRGPFQVRYGLGDRPWTVVGPSGVIGSYDRKDAAKHRAWVANIRKEDQ